MRLTTHFAVIFGIVVGLVTQVFAGVSVVMINQGTPISSTTTATGYTGWIVRLLSDSGNITAVDLDTASRGIFAPMIQRWTSSGADGAYDTPSPVNTNKNTGTSQLNFDSHILPPAGSIANMLAAVPPREDAVIGDSLPPFPANSDVVGYGVGGYLKAAFGIAGPVQNSTYDLAYLVLPADYGGRYDLPYLGIGPFEVVTQGGTFTAGLWPEPGPLVFVGLAGCGLVLRRQSRKRFLASCGPCRRYTWSAGAIASLLGIASGSHAAVWVQHVMRGAPTDGTFTANEYVGVVIRLVSDSGNITGIDFDAGGRGIFAPMVQRWTSSDGDGTYDAQSPVNTNQNTGTSILNFDSHILPPGGNAANIMSAVPPYEDNPANGVAGFPGNSNNAGYGVGSFLRGAFGIAGPAQSTTYDLAYLVVDRSMPGQHSLGVVATTNGTFPVILWPPWPEPNSALLTAAGLMCVFSSRRAMSRSIRARDRMSGCTLQR